MLRVLCLDLFRASGAKRFRRRDFVTDPIFVRRELARYRRAKFVYFPAGEGCSNYREFEALYAGAIPVVDVDPGAGRKDFWATIPHVPVSYPKHFRKWTRVCESNERRCFAPNRAAGAELVTATLRDVTPETLRRVAAEVKARGRSASITEGVLAVLVARADAPPVAASPAALRLVCSLFVEHVLNSLRFVRHWQAG